MKNKFINLYEKYFYLIIIIFFLTITYIGLLPYTEITNKSSILKWIIETNNSIFKAIRDYKYIIYLLVFILSGLYVVIKGSKKNRIFLGVLIFVSSFTFLNSILLKSPYYMNLEIKNNLVFPLFFIFLNVFEIFLKTKGKEFLEELLLKTIKIIVIYIGSIFLLGKVTGIYSITYIYEPFGYCGRFSLKNAISHIFVMFLPILMYFFYLKKDYKIIIYIIISIVCALLIGTKSAYIAVYSSIILFLLVMGINFIITKKINIPKLLIISTILIILISINNKIYAFQFMNQSIDTNSYESEEKNGETLNVVNFVLNGRQRALEQVRLRYNHEDIYTKIIGLGFYYPRYPYSIIEMDLSDILYKHGVIGITMFLCTAIYCIYRIIINIVNNFKKLNVLELIFPLASVGMATFSSIFSGHVMFHYITIYFYSFIIVFLYSKTMCETKTKQ